MQTFGRFRRGAVLSALIIQCIGSAASDGASIARSAVAVTGCRLHQGKLYATLPTVDSYANYSVVFVLLSKEGRVLARQWTSSREMNITTPLMWAPISFPSAVKAVRCELVDSSTGSSLIRDCTEAKWPHVDEGPSIDSVDLLWNSGWLIGHVHATFANMIGNADVTANGAILGFSLDERAAIWPVLLGSAGVSEAFFGLPGGEHALTVGIRDVALPGSRTILQPLRRICVVL